MTPWTVARRLLPLLLLSIEAAWLTPWSHLAGVLLLPPGTRGASGAGSDVPPLMPDPMLLALVAGAWAVRAAVPSRPPMHDHSSAWPRRLAVLTAIASVAGLSIVALHLYPLGARAASTTGWFGTVTAGHESGALLVAVIGLGAAWWRGTSVGATAPGDRHAGRRSVLAGVAIAAASAVATAVLPAALASIIPLATMIVIPAMVGALALSSLEESQLSRSGAPAGTAPDQRWLGMVAGLCAAVAIVGGIVAAVVGGHASSVIAVVRAIGSLIGIAFVWVASIAIIPILMFVEWLSGLMRGRGVPPPDVPFSAFGRQAPLEPVEGVELQPILDPAIVEFGLAIIALAIVAAVAWHLLRPSSSSDLDGAETELRSSVFKWSDLFGRRLTRHVATSSGDDDGNLVRKYYREFLAAMARRGSPREADETPARFARRIARNDTDESRQVPDPDDLAALTTAYERVRYRADAVPAEVVRAAAAAAARLVGAEGRDASRPRTS